MGIEQLYVIILACIVAASCSLCGVYLILRRLALISDAISHSVLLGIVCAFFLVHDLNSPILILGATITGVFMVFLTELLISSKRLKKDASIGLVFPLFFSVSILLINLFSGDIHLDQDAVLLGEIAFTPFRLLSLWGLNLGPVSLWVMGGILLLNIGFVLGFYKELKLCTFDRGLAAMLGFFPTYIHYALMSLVSVTAVGAFESVGAILVVALMIVPPASAYLLSRRLSHMIGLSVLFGILSSLLGYFMAFYINVSIAGSMAVMTGVLFGFVFIFSPSQGVLIKFLRYHKQRLRFSANMLLIQLFDHEGTDTEKTENTFSNLVIHMKWSYRFANTVVAYALQHGFINRVDDYLSLTSLGREKARHVSVMDT
tara:strand:+ start:642 stop:1757 length:1116 start_codon:yes stop_codon:yes gene_type:complete